MEPTLDLTGYVTAYLSSLNWGFIITLIVLAQLLTPDAVVYWLPFRIKTALLKVPRVLRVIAVGSVLIFIRKHLLGDPTVMSVLFDSLLFAIVFHKALFAKLSALLDEKMENATKR